MSDPIVLADELCELLQQKAPQAQVLTCLSACGGDLDAVLDELCRRDQLAALLSPDAAGDALRFVTATHSAAVLGAALDVMLTQGALAPAEALILRARDVGALAGLFPALIDRGRYDRLRLLLAPDRARSSPAQLALVDARPGYGHAELNAPARKTAADYVRAGRGAPYDVLIIPGFTPIDTDRPLPLQLIPAALQRLEQARADLHAGQAPLILVTGGSVHPPGTPHNEALMMREQLLRDGVPPERVLVEPYARHTPTNLRNAGRMMFELGLQRGLVETGFDRAVFSQAFYLSFPNLSTFTDRCERELGYSVGDLDGAGPNRVSFAPAQQVHVRDYDDPLDA